MATYTNSISAARDYSLWAKAAYKDSITSITTLDLETALVARDGDSLSYFSQELSQELDSKYVIEDTDWAFSDPDTGFHGEIDLSLCLLLSDVAI